MWALAHIILLNIYNVYCIFTVPVLTVHVCLFSFIKRIEEKISNQQISSWRRQTKKHKFNWNCLFLTTTIKISLAIAPSWTDNNQNIT